jgi:hypothetical protein
MSDAMNASYMKDVYAFFKQKSIYDVSYEVSCENECVIIGKATITLSKDVYEIETTVIHDVHKKLKTKFLLKRNGKTLLEASKRMTIKETKQKLLSFVTKQPFRFIDVFNEEYDLDY